MTPRQILLNLLAIAFAVGFPHLGLTPNFTYTIPILLLVWLVLRTSGERLSDVGFRLRSCSRRAALVGSIAAVVTLGVVQLVVFPVLELFVQLEETELGLYEFVRANVAQLVMMIVMAWLVGGLYEEVVLHGFVFTRLEKMIPGKSATRWSFVVTCLLFGAYHLQMGSAGAFNALLVGAVYLGLFLRFGRNLWVSIICHGMYNTVVMTLMYFGYL